MMAETAPYRFQIFLSREVRRVFRAVATRQETSMQKIAAKLIMDFLKTQPEGHHLDVHEEEE